MIFVYCSWVSTQWKWSVNLYKNMKGTATYRKREVIHKTVQKHSIHKIENKYTKQENRH